MKKIIFATIFLSFYGVTLSNASSIKKEHYEFFAEAIQASGYACSTSTGGFHIGPAHIGGQMFRVYCNNDALIYRVVTGDGVLCVEPWSRKAERCR